MLKTVPTTEKCRKWHRNSVRMLRALFLFSEIDLVKEATYLKQSKAPISNSANRGTNMIRNLYMAYLSACVGLYLCVPASAATLWEKASEIMQSVYKEVLGISTIAAIVTASVALLMMNFSRSGRTVDESRAWLKRIVITWVILNGLGFIMSYITPFFNGGQWTPGTT